MKDATAFKQCMTIGISLSGLLFAGTVHAWATVTAEPIVAPACSQVTVTVHPMSEAGTPCLPSTPSPGMRSGQPTLVDRSSSPAPPSPMVSSTAAPMAAES